MRITTNEIASSIPASAGMTKKNGNDKKEGMTKKNGNDK
jgi:hypothetical protein